MAKWSTSFAALFASGVAASAQVPLPHPEGVRTSLGSELFAATSSGFGMGAAVAVIGPPWLSKELAPTDGGHMLRVFGKSLFVVNSEEGTLTRIRLDERMAPEVFDFGPFGAPQDIHVVHGGTAWVALRHESRLVRIDLATGDVGFSVDLGVLAGPDETIALGTLERDGTRLFVQVTLVSETSFAKEFLDRGALAVVDLTTETLIDVDPISPGVQGVELFGAPPHLRMQILEETRTLFVSSTNGILDNRGGIEMVDLDLLVSVGFALCEDVVADLGGFVMTSPEGGYFVFHTDLTASTHLEPFTIAGGPSPEPEMIVLFDIVDSIGYDAEEQLIYLPSGFGTIPHGIFVFSTLSNEFIRKGRIDTGMPPHDVVVIPH